MKNTTINNIWSNSTYLLILLLPVIIISKSFYLNSYAVIATIIFIVNIIKFKKNPFSDKVFLIIFFFWITLIFNCLINYENTDGIIRSVTFFRFLGLYCFLVHYISSYDSNKQRIIFIFWSLIFLIVSLDLIYEFINGENILGNKNDFMGRLSSFMGNELKIGNYYFSFSLIVIAALRLFYLKKPKNEYFFVLLGIIILSTSFIIGERSNFLKNLFAFFIYFLLIFKDRIRNAFVFTSILATILFVVFENNPHFKARYFNEFIKPLSKGLEYFYKNSHYGAHADTAIQIFKNNKFFGTGIKNFRNESQKEIYFNEKFKYSESRVSTHPHNYYLEFLSETGIFGFLSFLMFIFFTIKTFINKKIKNHMNTAAFIILISFLFPILPSGSFLSSYNTFIFFTIYSLIFCKIKI